MYFYTTKKVGTTRERTPEGFLLCKGAVLARTGELLYAEGETPVKPGADGIAHIIRTEAEVFRPETMASANGKPVCNEHPAADVRPDNWKKLAVGVIMNARRGEDAESDLFIADLLITDQKAIDLVEDGKVELSCGYDADYEDDSERSGYGYQSNILINHVAIVEDGRCGPRCSIGDSKPKGKTMISKRLAARIRRAFAADDEAELEKALEHIGGKPEMREDDDDGKHMHVHLHQRKPHGDDDAHRARRRKDGDGEHGDVERRLDKLEITVEGIAKAVAKLAAGEREEPWHEDDDARGRHRRRDDDDAHRARRHRDDDEEEELEGGPFREEVEEDDDAHRARRHRDDDESEEQEERYSNRTEAEDRGGRRRATDLADELTETRALAEILAPGIRLPTHDASNPKRTTAAICRVRREALRQADRELVRSVTAGKAVSGMTCDAVAAVFRAAASLQRSRNNDKRVPRQAETAAGGGLGVAGPISTPAEFNEYMTKQRATLYN